MAIFIEKETDIPLPIPYEAIIETVVKEALDAESCPYEIELNCILTDNQEIAQINLVHRGIPDPTDVLSFPMIEYPSPGDFSHLESEAADVFNPETGELMLGDIIISVEKLREQAEKYGHSQERELGFLVAHSMLHLFGYDHLSDKEDAMMQDKQEAILRRLVLTRE